MPGNANNIMERTMSHGTKGSRLLKNKDPMIQYEATFLNGNDILVGPIYLVDTNHLPSSWRVFQFGNEVKTEVKKEILVDKSADPVQLPIQPKLVLGISTQNRKITPNPSSSCQLIQQNAYRLCNPEIEESIRSTDFHPVFPNNHGPFITNHNEWNNYMYGLTGCGKAIQNSKLWEVYGKGLNLIGRCHNASCKLQHPSDKIWKHGFRTIRLDQATFKCPSCFHQTFRLTNFLFSGARAVFRVKRTDDEMETSFTIQSGPFPEYIKFQRSFGRVDYEFIEIDTEDWENYSKHGTITCISCSGEIDFSDVNQDGCHYSCGHAYHRTCLQAVNNSCPVCCTMMVSYFAMQDNFEG